MKVERPGLSAQIAHFFGGKLCAQIIFILFLVQAIWLAVCAAYPMAFDEYYHFGLIQLHAQQWLPFFTHQPPTGTYGAVVRDPSYLYHWLMSYPYRLVNLFTHDLAIQVICLRLVNVALFAYALSLFRQLMRRLGLSAALTNASLLLFVLIPVVPFLAATINYDNLLMIVVPWSVLLALDVLAALRSSTVPLARLVLLSCVLLLGCLIKYPFLPVLAVIALFLLIAAWRYHAFQMRIWVAAWKQMRTLAAWQQTLLVILLLLSFGLFGERYGVNLVDYHTPVPKCEQVVNEQLCQQYGPWGRDYELHQTKPSNFHPSGIYIGSWVYGMWYRLFFAIGPEPEYDTQDPLFVMSLLAVGVAILLALGIVLRGRMLFVGHPERLLALLLILGYGVALFGDNLNEYILTAQPVAINGRYWVPFLPLFFVLGGLAWSNILRRTPTAKTWAACLAAAVFLLQGGGTMSYIVRSKDNWYWPNTTVRRVNGDIRSAVSPVIVYKSDQL